LNNINNRMSQIPFNDFAVFQKAISIIINNKEVSVENICKDLNISDKLIINFLKKTYREINSEFYRKNVVEQFVDSSISVLLSFARHQYGKNLAFTNDDNFDALVTSINFLGQELNFSTVTTNYTEDVFNSIGDLLLVVDNLGYILFVNNATCKILGYDKSEIERQHIKIILEDDVEFQFVLDDKNKRKVFNYRSKLNKFIPVSLIISKFSRKDNPFMGHVIIARDISLTLKYEKEIEKQNEIISKSNEELKLALVKAEKSEKLKSAFLANMSHEIRTPLNGIMGFSELLQYENSKEDYINYGKTILKCSNQLLGIVNDVLDISKIEAGLMQVSKDKCNINEILNDLCSIYKQKIIAENKNIELLLINRFKNDSRIISDELRIKQIISNLLDNAVKFSERGIIKLECYPNNDFIVFNIKDTGIGISKAELETVFKPFMQASQSKSRLYGGTGLGLAIAKGLVNILGGEISVTSTLNSGSEFVFSIPLIFDDSKINIEIEDTTFRSHLFDWENKTILLIEDDDISARLIKRLLEPSKVKVIHAKFGMEALEIFYSRNDVNMVIVDFELPDINGCEITKDIRKVNNEIPIIIQTAYASKEDEKKYFLAGCNSFIPKPIKSNSLLEVV